MQERIEGEILCYLCKGNVLVDAHVACSDHPETKLEYLVVAALTQVANWYTYKARMKMLRDVTPPPTLSFPANPDPNFSSVLFCKGLVCTPG